MALQSSALTNFLWAFYAILMLAVLSLFSAEVACCVGMNVEKGNAEDECSARRGIRTHCGMQLKWEAINENNDLVNEVTDD
jgi:hypothetical protein